MINSITLLGSSSGRNAGDASILSGIMDSIDDALSAQIDYEIPTIRPGFVRQNYPNRVRPVSMLPWSLSVKMLGLPTYRSILRTDLTLIFDAILFDRALFNPLFNFLSTLYLLLPQARKQGKKIGCYNVGAGPVETALGQKMLRELCEIMDFITVRDQSSFEILKGIGVQNPNILVTADAALNVPSASDEQVYALLHRAGLNPEKDILAINVSAYLDSWAGTGHKSVGKKGFLDSYSAALNRVSSELGAQLLFICTQYHDVPLTRALMDAVSCPVSKALISNRECSHYEIKGVLGKVSLLFAMRLHAVILASSCFTPSLALPHQPKLIHFLKTLGLERQALSFSEFGTDALVNHMLKGWETRSLVAAELRRRIPFEKVKASWAAELVKAIHEGRPIGDAIAEIRDRPQFSSDIQDTPQPGGAHSAALGN